ncbi:MAG: gluconokinase [Mucilaginibacter sp.]
MQRYILGIDIGTGSTKCVALDFKGKIKGTAQRHYAVSHPEQGFSEQDPELIWKAFSESIKDIVDQLQAPPVAISLSSAMHSVIPIDGNGRAMAGMITWADVRSESIAAEIRSSPAGERLYRATGTPIHPMSPLCKLIWLRENRATLFNAAQKFISIKGYIWHKLFRAFQIDYSIASATGLFDIKKLCWNDEACELASITLEKLSEPVKTSYSRNDMDPAIASLLDIPADTMFVIGSSDGCCANLGSHVLIPGIAALTIGTSGAVRVTSPFPIYNYRAMTFNYLLDEHTFVSGGAVNNGGNAVDWLLEKFLDKSSWGTHDYKALFAAIETIPPGSNGLLFLPYLYGERAPIWDANSSGAFLNIRPEHTQKHFLRAALEGICYALNDVLTSLEQESVNIEQVNVSGGFINAIAWIQLLADVTGKNLCILQFEDASAIGAIYLAAAAWFPEFNRFSDPGDSKIIKPNIKNHEVYLKIFSLYKKLYPNMKETMNILMN